MAIDNQTVKTIAKLARLEIDENDVEKYRSDISNILNLVEQMDAVNTDGVEPMTHPFDATLRLRDDIITEQNNREKFQKIAPSSQDGLYLVPKVID